MKLSNEKYWIWLSLALGYSNRKIKTLFEMYEDISDFYNGGEKEWKFCGIFSSSDLHNLQKTDLEIAEKIMERCDEYHYQLIAIDDERYPECLLNIYNPPAIWYVEGSLPDVDHILTIGIVGTRTASNYGLKNSYSIGYSLSKYGTITISGGALGIDCASHRGTLAANGVTICVLGCGINYPYLRQNADMRKAIALRGAVISEYPPDTPPMPYHFPARNRIIAALANGILIIESGKNSGSLITADCALDMGKELFALLGNNSPNNEGSNERIKEGTAIPITDFMDILIAFKERYEQA
ncbi:MAG: DNA-processing protein DprA, partial [Ruminococcus sp.]|nr:DNA-processing protein DprA [Ruminococcus sp.]